MEGCTYLKSMICITTDDEGLLGILSNGALIFTSGLTKARHWAIF
jgi:hypothetical protein